ncbi:hypothetical protein MSG37_00265 [Shewanella sp. 1CM18E]|uniref:hypothetical protein n=1 Tax=Shewanella sp. 1CM18E TaxID=2929169 RepID=UPI0020BFB5EF|nr:hypothetical protein [Shewanella sp. 1CM18E]MCK8043306.1 hypothetical protein [Shewanella sp. 1CM18E]
MNDKENISKSELHVLIIWEEARYKETEIINDLSNNFNVRARYNITWNNGNAYKNFSRFYAIKARYAKSKMKHCGTGEFILLIVEDKEPIYSYRKTNDGEELVNKRVFDCKVKYREWTGNGHKIHATNSVEETSHNLALVFGVTYEEYYAKLPKTFKEESFKRDLIGTNGWDNFPQLFNVLNNTLEYCVLRNFEGFFDNMTSEDHLDIDIMARNYEEAQLILNGRELYPFSKRVANEVIVSGERVNFDIRTIGDGYMDSEFSEKLISSRYLFENIYFRPENKIYFYSLLYHALVHKERIAADYENRFEVMANNLAISGIKEQNDKLSLLKSYMGENCFEFVEPNDLSVFYNFKLVGAKSSFKRHVVMKYRAFKKMVKRMVTLNER